MTTKIEKNNDWRVNYVPTDNTYQLWHRVGLVEITTSRSIASTWIAQGAVCEPLMHIAMFRSPFCISFGAGGGK